MILQVKEIIYPPIPIRMCPAHEAVTDHADVERFGHSYSLTRLIAPLRMV